MLSYTVNETNKNSTTSNNTDIKNSSSIVPFSSLTRHVHSINPQQLRCDELDLTPFINEHSF